MTVSAVNGSSTPAAASATAPSSADTTTFDQAFAQYFPAAASFMLMSVAQDAVQEIMQAGDENANAPDPAG
jgi:hypothetical protein